MYKILQEYNLGPEIIKWIKICQNGAVSYIINNGYLSEKIHIRRGLRQGCPLSCQLFDLVIEALAVKICNNVNIEGVVVGSTKKVLSQYADDLWLVLKHKPSCYTALVKDLNWFAEFTGLKVNYDKTEILRIGSLHKTDAHYYSGLPLHWSDGPIKILGIWVSPDQELMTNVNYKELIVKARSILNMWSRRSLTLLGKILVINTLIIPLFVYRLQVLPSPDSGTLKEFKAMILQFLWEGKKSKIAYEKLIMSYKRGRLQLVDLELKDTAMKTKWVPYLLSQESVTNEIFRKIWDVSPQVFWEANISVRDIKTLVKPSMYRDIWVAWSKVNFHNPGSVKQISTQVLWNNSFIKEEKRLLFFKEWYKKGIIYFGDLIKDKRFKTCMELHQEYKVKLSVIDYARIRNALPKEWIKITKLNIGVEIEISGLQFVKGNLRCSRIVYNTLRDRKKIKSKSKQLWWGEGVEYRNIG